MKSFSLLILLLFTYCLSAQPPEYYRAAIDKKGKELRTVLQQIIQRQYRLTYDQLWNAYQFTDGYLDNNEVFIWDIYTYLHSSEFPKYRYNIDKCITTPSSEGHCYNREHTTPASWFNNVNSLMYTDLFNVYPADGYINSTRNNNPYGEVDNNQIVRVFSNGSKLGNVKTELQCPINRVFEPADEFKGDIARNYFYMATRYAGSAETWSGGVYGAEHYGLQQWAVQMFLRWHKEDPVSDKERLRNNEVQKIQGNRNPFIDFPQWVECIWENCSETVKVPTISMLKVKQNNTLLFHYTIQNVDMEFYHNNLTNCKLNIGKTNNFEQGELALQFDGKQFTALPYRLLEGQTTIYLQFSGEYCGNLFTKIDSLVVFPLVAEKSSIHHSLSYSLQKNHIQFNLPDNTERKIQLSVYDTVGKEVKNANFTCQSPISFDLTGIKTGLYFFVLQFPSYSHVERIFIQP